MTAQHAAMCKVGVGEPFPDLELVDLEGTTHRLKDLMGDTLTVVLFWTGDRALARAELADLGPDVSQLDPESRIALVGIAVGETAESAGPHVASAGAGFPQLLDPQGQAFSQVGSDRLPRTYLLDSKGNILWFDIEYSRSTRRDLRQAIRVALANP
jgi:peroxiredoxin